MAKAKKTKPGDLIRWRVSMITSTPAKFIDFTMAPDQETAERQVAEAHEIPETLRDAAKFFCVGWTTRQIFSSWSCRTTSCPKNVWMRP